MVVVVALHDRSLSITLPSRAGTILRQRADTHLTGNQSSTTQPYRDWCRGFVSRTAAPVIGTHRTRRLKTGGFFY